MPWKITNVSLDAAHAMKRRTAKAARMEMEPIIAGARLRLRTSMTITDAQYEVNKTRLVHFEAQGVITFEKVGGTPKSVVAEAKPAEPVKVPEPVKVEEPVPEAKPVEEPVPEPVKPTLPPSSKDGGSSKSSKKRGKK